MQTAKTVENREVKYTGGAFVYVTEDTKDNDNDASVLPGVNIGIRYGLGQRTDIGMFYASGGWGHARVDVKQNIWQKPDGNAYLSTGFAIENHNYHDDQKTSGMELFNKGWAASIPLFYSFGHNKPVTIYTAQRFTLSFNELDLLKNWDYYMNEYTLPLNQYIDRQNTLFYSGGLGFKWGKNDNKKWFAEASYSFHTNRYIYCNNAAPEQNEVRKVTIGQLEFGIGMTFGSP